MPPRKPKTPKADAAAKKGKEKAEQRAKDKKAETEKKIQEILDNRK